VTDVAVSAPQRLDWIEGMRGLAVGAVLVFHAGIWAGLGQGPMKLLGLGQRGVDLFFVISGFCMLWPLLRDGRLRAIDPGVFLRRRWVRIAPPYLAAVAIAVVVSAAMYWFGGNGWFSGRSTMQFTFGPESPDLVGNLATHLTFTHGFFQEYDRGIDGAFWSLATEWQFYVLLPLLVLVARHWGAVAALCTTVAVPVGYIVVSRIVSPGFITETPVGYDNILFRLVEFGAGMAVALAVAGMLWLPTWTWATAVSLVAMAAVHLRAPLTAGPFVYAVGFAALMLAASCGGSLVQRVVTWSPLRALGRVSYSAYLVHGTVYMLVALPFTQLETAEPVRQGIIFVVGPAVAVALSVLFYRAVEVPSVRMAHRRRPVTTPAPVTG
jgi:peptidoglycan/LPS O-acetylase OafA/YrhL